MRSKGTWVALFYIAATLLVSVVFNLALTDAFTYWRIEDTPILGARFTLVTLVSLILAAAAAVYAAFVNKKARAFVEQCIVELDKVAWPTWSDTKKSTFTVIITSLIAAVILGFFDTFFGWLTSHNLFLG
jgi:preprotein translocase SecE subunit